MNRDSDTPTIEGVRGKFATVLNASAGWAFSEEWAVAFDRWLTAHDANTRAAALREAADLTVIYAWQPGDGHTVPPDEQAAYMLGANDAHAVVERLLRERAEADQ